MGNMKKIKHNAYICYTQAGFRKATKDFVFGDNKPYPNRYKEVKQDMIGHPKTYPSPVVMTWGYAGYEYLYCTCIPIAQDKLLKRHYILMEIPKEKQ